ncbi:MAG TPA: hypothetical protein VF156_15585 [Agromyces sp.]
MTRPSHSRRAVRRFAAARDRAARARQREALAKLEALNRGVAALARLDFSRFAIACRDAGLAMRTFLQRMENLLPECNAPGCKRRATGGYLFDGKRYCPLHLMMGTGLGRPRGILAAAEQDESVLEDAAVKRALAEFTDMRRTEQQLERILGSKPKASGASGRVSSIAIHVQPPAIPHPDPAQLHRAAHRRADGQLRDRG